MFSASKTSGPSGYNLTNSLRFRSSASAYLNRTPTLAGSTTIGTFSNWLKLGAISTDKMMYHVAGTSGNNNRFYISFNADNTFQIVGYNSSASIVLNLNTTQVLRDPSAWYHIVVAIDTTQATSSNRAKLYINGNQVTAFSTATYPSQNQALGFTNNTSTLIGANQGPSNYYDGYMTDINFIDGQALTPSSFGSTNATTGVWQPAKYTGTYGTNGFYLNFSNIALTSGSNTGLGKDYSGNGNYWNTNNISVTSGTTYDAMTDVPTLTSATVANYAVLNPVNTNATLSSANLNYSSPSNAPAPAYSTIGMTSGKWYYEYQVTSTNCVVGVWGNGNAGMTTSYPIYYWDIGASSASALTLEKSSGTSSGSLGSLASNDIYGIALDIDNTTIYFYKNNTLVQTVTGMVFVGPLFFVCGSWSSGTSATGNANFGQRPFTYTPPSGYVALNTYNLPTSTIVQGNKYMDATLYAGNTTTVTATNAGGFKPDLVWIKDRTSIAQHVLTDSVRGTSAQLFSSLTNAEQSNSTYVTSFNSNGFTVGVGNSGTGVVNNSGDNFVGWQWQAGQGSTSSNTNGSITSTVSVNASAGFSIVTYTGTGANATVGHGLGVAPSMIIIKRRNGATDWATYHASVGNTKALFLNRTLAADTGVSYWNNTSPTSTLFTVGTGADVNPSSGTMVAYCWAEISGFSRFGSYTGNGSTDGPFIYLGFRPKYVMIKRTDATQNWPIIDTSRDTYNVANKRLFSNLSDAEDTGIPNYLDVLSNGFKCRDSNISYNASGGTYIYAAFAENPFKNALAR